MTSCDAASPASGVNADWQSVTQIAHLESRAVRYDNRLTTLEMEHAHLSLKMVLPVARLIRILQATAAYAKFASSEMWFDTFRCR